MSVLLESDDACFYQTKEISLISEPLLNNSAITYFCHVRRFNDDSRLCLSTKSDFNNAYAKQELHCKDYFEQELDYFTDNYILWSLLEDSEIYQIAKSTYDIVHGVTLIEKDLEYCDFFHFGTDQSRMVDYSEYLKYLDTLKNFILYYKCVAKDLLQRTTPYKLPKNSLAHDLQNDKYQLFNGHSSKDNLAKQLQVPKYPLKGEFAGIYLTQREIECLKWLIQGKSSMEIAIILDISRRTVEKHINNVKNKLGCYKQSALIYKLSSMDLFRIIDNIDA